MTNSQFRKLCLIDSPGALVEHALGMTANHPLANFCTSPAALKDCGQPIVLYGAGRFAQSVIRSWSAFGLKPSCCVDSNPALHGKTLLDIPIQSPQQLTGNKVKPLVVVAAMHTTQIQSWLNQQSIPHLFAELDGRVGCLPGHNLLTRSSEFEQVWNLLGDEQSRQVLIAAAKSRLFQDFWFDMIGNPFLHALAVGAQYFVRDIFRYDAHRSYVDCGAYDGDFIVSLERELCQSGQGSAPVHAFEADAINLERLRNNLKHYDLKHVTLHHALVGNADNWIDNPDFNNCRAGEASSPVKMTRLDNALANVDVGFIKMDIEGAEIDALAGSRQVINTCRPNLAVCAYHKTDHLLDVPLTIHNMYSNCALYFRHHSTTTLWETVCYARPH